MKKKFDDNKWRNILYDISKNVTEPTYKTWFTPLTPLDIDEEAGVLYFATNNEMIYKVLNMRYISTFEDSVENVLNKKYKVVVELLSENEIEERHSNTSTSTKPIKVETTTPKKPAPRRPKTNDFTEEYFLNPKYNFENFIVGANNEYAHAVAVAVAEAPAVVYNPLFIHGGSGLGKTHLMHAIGHYILENNSDYKVLYVSSEMFTSELIRAMQDPQNRNKKLQEFKEKYRNVDVLLIDDIQFLEGKEATQGEFFHTFNTLYDLNKQIVITSDRHPSKLNDLDDRLKTRFQWNIIADIQPPDFETRVAILKNNAKKSQIDIDDDVLEVINLIAEKVKFNIRELESALSRLISYSTIYNENITVRFAIKMLNDIFTAGERDISCENIKKAVCKHWGVKISDIESKKRKREYAFPRQVAMYLCREMTNLSLPQIGKYFGGRDHTTVMHACDKISNEIKENEVFAQDIRKLRNDIY